MPRRVWPGRMENSMKWGILTQAAPQRLSVWGVRRSEASVLSDRRVPSSLILIHADEGGLA